ncbi:MAG: hypothetical protein V3V00_15795 [Saprospiraceae bacterium]
MKVELQKIAKNIEKELITSGSKMGFALVVFDFDNLGKTDYISNANRKDMIQALFETAYRLKNNEDERKV